MIVAPWCPGPAGRPLPFDRSHVPHFAKLPFRGDRDVIWYSRSLLSRAAFPKFSDNPSRHLHCGYMVTYISLQLAYFMGFTRVYLLGVDFYYSLTSPSQTVEYAAHYGHDHFSSLHQSLHATLEISRPPPRRALVFLSPGSSGGGLGDRSRHRPHHPARLRAAGSTRGEPPPPCRQTQALSPSSGGTLSGHARADAHARGGGEGRLTSGATCASSTLGHARTMLT